MKEIEVSVEETGKAPKASGKKAREVSDQEEFRRIVTGQRFGEADPELRAAILQYRKCRALEKEYRGEAEELAAEIKATALAHGIEGWFVKVATETAVVVEVCEQTRKTLSAKRLEELGVPVDVIEAAKVESDPFYVLQVKDVGKK